MDIQTQVKKVISKCGKATIIDLSMNIDAGISEIYEALNDLLDSKQVIKVQENYSNYYKIK
jgi:hypothetical protein